MKKRQALYFEAPYQVAVREEEMPAFKPEQILVRTTLSAISAGTEMLFYRGEFPREMAVDATITSLEEQNDYPLKYGYAAVGVADEVGEGVDEKWLGKRVFSFQPHQSRFVAGTDDLFQIPDKIPDEDAVFLPNMETAVNLVMDSNPLIGERVIVFGQGIIGLLTTALLRQFPLERLVVVDPVPMRREAALALGVDTALAPEDVEENDFDLAIELSGGANALNIAVDKVGYSGRIIVGSWYGRKPVSLDLGGRFHRDRIQLISSQVSTIAPQFSGRWDKVRRFDVVWEMLGRVRPSKWISSRIPFGEAEQAYATLDTRPQDVLQVVFKY
jgi:2-desacetyl-2-hydroxyethyl bacteriochlorophyllide A dehydrogenase